MTMGNAVALHTNGSAPSRFAPDQVDLIKRTICPGATDDELRLFMYHAEKTGLDPLARQIYSIERQQQRNGKWITVRSIQTSIDGFRLVAQRSGEYQGQVGPQWCGDDGQWRDVWLKKDAPAAARVGVLREGFREPCWGVARFDAYAQTNKEGKPTRMWATMPDVMLAKCAEALALRKAFPQELSGLYTGDEMEQASQPAEDHRAPTPAPAVLVSRPVEPPHHPETGEVSPHQIPRGGTAPEWGSKMIAALKSAASIEEVTQWMAVNADALDQMEKSAPKTYAMIEKAERDRIIALAPTPKEEEPLPFA
jgi:phage recombination protein Bet